MTNTSEKTKIDKRFVILAVFFAICAYILLPQIGDFKSSRHLLSHPNLVWTSQAILCIGVTYLAAAATYWLLALRKLNYWRTALVQLAAMFVNRLLPSGIGALGANFIYLKKNKHDSVQAGTIVTINNLLGFVGHGLLTLAVLLAYSGNVVGLSSNENHSWATLVRYGVGTALILLAVVILLGRNRFNKYAAEVLAQLSSYRSKPWKLGLALLTSMTLTLFNVLSLFLCMHAVGAGLSFFAVFLIFSFAISAATVTPTPGGLGGYEAALVAGFVAYGLTSPIGLAIALLYRLVSYWLPLVVGGVAFGVCQKKSYI